MIDYYGRARRQGASAFIAMEFERYATKTVARGDKPMSCKAFLDRVDRFEVYPTGD
jgi:hypothetical protein